MAERVIKGLPEEPTPVTSEALNEEERERQIDVCRRMLETCNIEGLLQKVNTEFLGGKGSLIKVAVAEVSRVDIYRSSQGSWRHEEKVDEITVLTGRRWETPRGTVPAIIVVSRYEALETDTGLVDNPQITILPTNESFSLYDSEGRKKEDQDL